jgi:hypothetical protein
MAKLSVSYLLILLAILFPPAWPVIVGWAVYALMKRQQRSVAIPVFVNGQPVRLPGQVGAL